MNVNTYDTKSFHDARISIPKAFKGRVLRDPDHRPDSPYESQRWDWFEVAPNSFGLASSWEDARKAFAGHLTKGYSIQDITRAYGLVTNVTHLYE